MVNITGLRLFNAGGSNQKLDHASSAGARGIAVNGFRERPTLFTRKAEKSVD
jgi:hypothetical protein